MRRIETALPGVMIIEPQVFADSRGFFMETFHAEKMASLGIRDTFVQDNHSCSAKGILRGLHFQLRHAQAKLCRVVVGEVLDVAVDVRYGSPHFGKWVAVRLSAENKRQIYIPPGFAHGFLVLSESAEFLYKCSEFYHPEDERGILWSDPDLKIDWGIADPALSGRDQRHLRLAELSQEDLPLYSGG